MDGEWLLPPDASDEDVRFARLQQGVPARRYHRHRHTGLSTRFLG